MTVDASTLLWDGAMVDLDSVTAISYSAKRRRHRGLARRVTRAISLWRADGAPFVIELDGGTLGHSLEEPQRAAYGAITGALYAATEPRLRAEALRRMAAGDVVGLGHWRLDDRGLHDGAGLSIAWEHLPTAVLDGEAVAITHRLECGRVEHRRLSMSTPNAVLLPELLDEAAIVFS
ncbi:MAG: hypothetical protein AAF480_11400 [Actinomycetota bacterium]